ncbi:MAG: hypothetical protein LLG05_09610 [Porphyromonadaceae bacterium]|nr:hypothetical protein [Porphyromonadaceae bacterium]
MESNLNPNIREIQYGKKELHSLSLYPLSLADQFTVTDIVTEIAQQLMDAKNKGITSDVVFVTATMKILQENISKVLALIADITVKESDEIIKQLTNDQLMDLLNHVWEVNFEPLAKKGKSLLEKGKQMFVSTSSSPDFSDSIHSTGSRTSSEKDIEKAE